MDREVQPHEEDRNKYIVGISRCLLLGLLLLDGQGVEDRRHFRVFRVIVLLRGFGIQLLLEVTYRFELLTLSIINILVSFTLNFKRSTEVDQRAHRRDLRCGDDLLARRQE